MKYRLGIDSWPEDALSGAGGLFDSANQMWLISMVMGYTGCSATAIGVFASFVTSGRITIDTDDLQWFMNPFERDPLTAAKEHESLIRAIDDLVLLGFLEFAGHSESEGAS